MTKRTWLRTAGLLLVVVLLRLALSPDLGVAATGAAHTHPGGKALGGWVRSPVSGFTSPAGDLCPFELQSTVLIDQVYVRTTSTFPDGSPRRQQYVGPLVVRLTDTSTGRSVVRNLSGSAVTTYAADGSFDFALFGPAAVGFRSGDSLPRGFYVLRGVHVVHFAADGTRTITLDRGTEENVCESLVA